MSQQLIDIGANLTHESFAEDFAAVLQRAAQAGVHAMVVTGSCQASSVAAMELAQRHPELYATAGVHPHMAREFTADSAARLRDLLHADKVVAVGECGLDFYRNYSSKAEQERCFKAQLEIACATGKPVFLHERAAHDRFVAILQEYLSDLSRVVVHCFTGTESQLAAYLELGCYIGMTGWICDERRGYGLREYIGAVPADRLMLETDAPYLLPRDMRPKPKSRRNEPMYLPYILHAVADAVGKSPTQLTKETTDTALTFFNLTI